jgi:hypothetical protein
MSLRSRLETSIPFVDETAANASMPLFFNINQVRERRKSIYAVVIELYRAVNEAGLYLAG